MGAGGPQMTICWIFCYFQDDTLYRAVCLALYVPFGYHYFGGDA